MNYFLINKVSIHMWTKAALWGFPDFALSSKEPRRILSIRAADRRQTNLHTFRRTNRTNSAVWTPLGPVWQGLGKCWKHLPMKENLQNNNPPEGRGRLQHIIGEKNKQEKYTFSTMKISLISEEVVTENFSTPPYPQKGPDWSWFI